MNKYILILLVILGCVLFYISASIVGAVVLYVSNWNLAFLWVSPFSFLVGVMSVFVACIVFVLALGIYSQLKA